MLPEESNPFNRTAKVCLTRVRTLKLHWKSYCKKDNISLATLKKEWPKGLGLSPAGKTLIYEAKVCFSREKLDKQTSRFNIVNLEH